MRRLKRPQADHELERGPQALQRHARADWAGHACCPSCHCCRRRGPCACQNRLRACPNCWAARSCQLACCSWNAGACPACKHMSAVNSADKACQMARAVAAKHSQSKQLASEQILVVHMFQHRPRGSSALAWCGHHRPAHVNRLRAISSAPPAAVSPRRAAPT